MVTLFDAITLDDGTSRITRDGYLVADVKVARTGVQIYRGFEMGRPELETVRAYRPPEEVFADKAMASFAHRPMTNEHPSENVTSRNWKTLTIGHTGDTVGRDGEFLRVPLILMDQEAIDAVKAGKRQLSAGYSIDLDWTPGETSDGQAYDVVQRNISANHIALVDAARGGPSLRIGDETMTTKPLVVDGITINLDDTAYQVVSKLQSSITALTAARDTAEGTLASERSAHAKALEAKDGEIAALKAKIPDAAALDAMVAERVKIASDAGRILGADYVAAGKTVDQIRRDAVAHALGADAVKDRSSEYIAAAFDTLVVRTPTVDPLRRQPGARVATGDRSAGDAAYREMVQAQQDAWKQPGQPKAA